MEGSSGMGLVAPCFWYFVVKVWREFEEKGMCRSVNHAFINSEITLDRVRGFITLRVKGGGGGEEGDGGSRVLTDVPRDFRIRERTWMYGETNETEGGTWIVLWIVSLLALNVI